MDCWCSDRRQGKMSRGRDRYGRNLTDKFHTAGIDAAMRRRFDLLPDYRRTFGIGADVKF